VKLVVKAVDDDGRLDSVRCLLATRWQWVVADHRDREAFAAALADADALISMTWSAAEPPAPRLRLLQLPGAGTDGVVADAVPARAWICNAFGHEIGIAEYVMAAILEWLIGVQRMHREFREGRWWGSYLCGPRHGDACGKTLGIVGYGRIGREVARRAHAFGMRVIAASRTPGPGDAWCERVHAMSDLHAVLAQADFVLVALPLDPTTAGVIDAQALGVMKPDAVIVNVGRGPTIDEEALFEACRSRGIGGAIIDAWYSYPPQGAAAAAEHAPSRFPFGTLDNVVMTPHASAWSHALAERRGAIIAENLDRLARGEPLINVVRAPAARDA
jgi:phosphoglycerate dehydrogenase-like enzyme